MGKLIQVTQEGGRYLLVGAKILAQKLNQTLYSRNWFIVEIFQIRSTIQDQILTLASIGNLIQLVVPGVKHN